MEELGGKVAVVTGAASGIGRALADRLAAEGMQLVLVDIEPEALARAERELRETGARVLAVAADVADGVQMDRLGERVQAELGGAHVLCNNAGVAGGGVMWELSEADWEFVLRVNLWGVIHGIRVFVPDMVARNEGHIVNTASMAGLSSVPGLGPYNATKHAVVTLSETLHGELAGAAPNVGVSVLCPGFVNTRIYESDRNRPPALQNPGPRMSSTEIEERRRLADAFFAQAMQPAEVAEQVLQAIRQRRFYVLTHPNARAAVEARLKAILDGEAPPVSAPAIFGRD